MFGIFKKKNRIAEIREAVAEIVQDHVIPHRVCDTCGCFIARGKEVKGKSKIKTRKKYNLELAGSSPLWRVDEEYIHTPYYCGRCAPKEEIVKTECAVQVAPEKESIKFKPGDWIIATKPIGRDWSFTYGPSKVLAVTETHIVLQASPFKHIISLYEIEERGFITADPALVAATGEVYEEECRESPSA